MFFNVIGKRNKEPTSEQRKEMQKSVIDAQIQGTLSQYLTGSELARYKELTSKTRAHVTKEQGGRQQCCQLTKQGSQCSNFIKQQRENADPKKKYCLAFCTQHTKNYVKSNSFELFEHSKTSDLNIAEHWHAPFMKDYVKLLLQLTKNQDLILTVRFHDISLDREYFDSANLIIPEEWTDFVQSLTETKDEEDEPDEKDPYYIEWTTHQKKQIFETTTMLEYFKLIFQITRDNLYDNFLVF